VFEKVSWPKFSGEEDVENFIYDLENTITIATSNGWTEEEILNTLPYACLKGAAKTWWRSCDTENPDFKKKGLKEILKSLKDRFTFDKTGRTARQELIRTRQGEEESITKYAYTLLDKAMKVKSKMDDAEKIYYFVDGLTNSELRDRVQMMVCTSNEDLTFDRVVQMTELLNIQLEGKSPRSGKRTLDKLREKILNVNKSSPVGDGWEWEDEEDVEEKVETQPSTSANESQVIAVPYRTRTTRGSIAIRSLA
jgi:hypothetical protein